MNAVGKVDAYAFMPLPRKLITHVNASQPLNMEHRKVSQDSELVHLGACFVSFICLQQILLDLLTQFFPPMDFIPCFW